MLARIDSMNSDHAAFVARLNESARILSDDERTDRPPDELATLLHQKLNNAKSDSLERSRLEALADRGDQKLAELKEQFDRERTVLKRLCAEAGTETHDSLPEIEQRSSEKTKNESTKRRMPKKQLTLVAEGTAVDQFAEETESKDPAEIRERIGQLSRTLEELEPKRNEAQQSVGAIKRELAEINGDVRALELNQSLQFLSAEIHRDARQYAKLRVASMILRQAMDHYRKEKRKPGTEDCKTKRLLN